MSTDPPATRSNYVDLGDADFHKGLSNLHIQMIALGGAIGTGLFLGVGSRLAVAGPALIVSYLVAGALIYAMMRALGQMVLYRPTTGSFVSYAREFVSDRWSFLTGWIYVALCATAGCVEIAAIGVYVNFWFPELPGWIPALAALVVIIGVNLLAVKAFGIIELGASGIKVVAIIIFLIVGVAAVVLAAFGRPLGESVAALQNLWTEGGFAPNGMLGIVLVMQGVVFSFSGVEIVATSAGETATPQRTIPQAIRGVVARILIFYVGSVAVLAVLMPWHRYTAEESPFVTALASLGVTSLGGVMNFIVLTAAISGLNATIYSTVRMLRNLAANSRAPRFANYMNRHGSPAGSLLALSAVFLLGVILISFAGAMAAFEIVLGGVAVFVLFGWITIFVSHLGYLRKVRAGEVTAPAFRAGGAAVDYVCLALLVGLALWMMFDTRNPHWYYSLCGAVILLGGLNIAYEIVRRRHPMPDSHLPIIPTPQHADPQKEHHA